MMRWKWFWAVVFALLMIQSAAAVQLPEELERAIPAEAEELLDEMEESADTTDTLSQGLARLWDRVFAYFGETVKAQIGSVVVLLSIVLICSLADDCFQATGNSKVMNYVPIAGALAITVAAAGNMRSLLGVGLETLEELNVFSKALLPTLSAAIAASGGVVSAGVRHVAGVFFADLMITLVCELLLPLVYFHVAASAADAMLPQMRLKSIAQGISKLTTWLLTGGLVLYTGYLTLTGAAAGSADALATQLTKSAMGVVPVVGGIISDAAGTVLAGAAVLKNTIGVVGMLAILSICLVPFLELAVQYLLYKVSAFLAGTVGSTQLVGLIDALGSAFGLVLGMTGACTLMLLISIITSITAVTA